MPTRMERRAEKVRLQRRETVRWLAELAVVLLAALLVRTFVFSLTTVQGPSMMDTLLSGQVVAVDKTYFHLHEPQHGMVVICRYPGSREYFVKRIMALAGDTIEITGGVTFVNSVASTVCVVILYLALRPALERANLLPKAQKASEPKADK